MSYKIVLNIKTDKKEKSFTLELPDNDFILFINGMESLYAMKSIDVGKIIDDLIDTWEDVLTSYVSIHTGMPTNKIYVTDYGIIDDTTISVAVSI